MGTGDAHVQAVDDIEFSFGDEKNGNGGKKQGAGPGPSDTISNRGFLGKSVEIAAIRGGTNSAEWSDAKYKGNRSVMIMTEGTNSIHGVDSEVLEVSAHPFQS